MLTTSILPTFFNVRKLAQSNMLATEASLNLVVRAKTSIEPFLSRPRVLDAHKPLCLSNYPHLSS
jgi:hypothetical protein